MAVVPGGIVDEYLNTAGGQGRRLHRLSDRRDIAKVGFEEVDRMLRRCRKPLYERQAWLLGDVDERNPRSLHREGFHQRCPDAGTAAGDEHARILEVRKLGLRHRRHLIH
ncbi:hypothetical protein D3C86_1522410 [compost metagenome]